MGCPLQRLMIIKVEDNKARTPSGRVFIAEDSQTNAMVAIELVKRLGLDFEHVADGAGAVDVALNKSFDAVLMDVSMPNMDGITATRILRERGYDKPIIAMTAHALQGDRDRALESGMSGYVTKPVRPNALRAELEKWLSSDAPIASSGRLPGLKEASALEIEHHAHSLKGAAANIGATHLSALATQLEASARDANPADQKKLIGLIEDEATVVRSDLLKFYIKTDTDD